MASTSLHPDLVFQILYGATNGRRFTQDTPILPEAWTAFAKASGKPVEALIVPRKSQQAHHVATEIYARLKDFRNDGGQSVYGVSDMPGLVTVTCNFAETVNVLLPLTRWWTSDGMAYLTDTNEKKIAAATRKAFERLRQETDPNGSSWPLVKAFDDIKFEGKPVEVTENTVRFLILAGALQAVDDDKVKSDLRARIEPGGEERNWVSKLENISPAAVEAGVLKVLRIKELKKRGVARSAHYKRLLDGPAGAAGHGQKPGDQADNAFDFQLIFTLSLDRKGRGAVATSVPTTKADAARRLFDLNKGCSGITWAVIDSGIDATHRAFRRYRGVLPTDGPEPERAEDLVDDPENSRINYRYRMAYVRRLRDRDELVPDDKRQALAEEIAAFSPHEKAAISEDLDTARKDLENDRPLDWDLAERLVRVRHEEPPQGNHGTHVAGILGGLWRQTKRGKSRWVSGMCPDISLIDFDVMGKNLRATEFAVIAALRLVRHLNERNDFMVVHGANLSLSIPHDVTNYACGRTPVCAECETLVSNGVVVVAAAGNVGYNAFRTKNGFVPLHTETSITDPGNAEAVITVGSTHRLEPHTYGVSYFSSRGPTGDGRMKPDLVAPGEKIDAPIAGNEIATLEGTSMAAPHVSGAAALIMARFSEFEGSPARIKEVLCSTATDLGRDKAYQGRGLVDVLRALQSI